MDAWIINNSGQNIMIHNIPSLVNTIYITALTPRNILAGLNQLAYFLTIEMFFLMKIFHHQSSQIVKKMTPRDLKIMNYARLQAVNINLLVVQHSNICSRQQPQTVRQLLILIVLVNRVMLYLFLLQSNHIRKHEEI